MFSEKLHKEKMGICLFRSNVMYIFLLKQSNEEGIEDHETNNQFYRVTKMISSVAALYFSGLRKELKLSVKLIP